MRKAIRRILFYIRYEMTSDVKMRIEMGIAICMVLLCLGFAGLPVPCSARIADSPAAEE